MILANANAVLSSVSAAGLIGNWSPGIGDPSFAGWLTVVLYFFAAYRCYRLAARKDVKLVRGEATVWWLFTLALVALGINKQLDLQTALTEIGRILARGEGWYEERREIQADFVGLVVLIGSVSMLFMVWITRFMPSATRTAVAGGAALVTFVVVRAASFHHVDRFIGRRVLGVKFNWALEIGGISVILAGTYLRGRARSPIRRGPRSTMERGARTSIKRARASD